MFDTYKMSLIPLTPIHVGSGETMSPGEYFILDDMIYVVNLGAIPAEEMGDLRKELLRWIVDNPITWVINVARSEPLKNLIRKYASFKCKSTKVNHDIQARWGKGQSGLEIAMLNRGLNSAIIPGSSIKGALRTALIWKSIKGELDQVPLRDVDKWERRVLARKPVDVDGNWGIEDDLLRNLKVSDSVTSSSISTRVLQPSHVGMSDEAAGQQLQDYRECFAKANYDKPYSISGSLSIERAMLERRGMQGLITRDGILASCRMFYSTVMDAEKAYWNDGTSADDEAAMKWCLSVEEFARGHADGALIRLGWGSGMHAMGMNLAKLDGRHPQGSIDFNYYYNPRTRILIDGCPPGWALLKLEEI